jgi:hypothetical protein
LRPKLIALNGLLLFALAVIAWQGRARWEEARALRHDTLNITVKPVAPPPIAAAPKPEAAVATRYADIAGKNLFSKDRNATIVVDPPKVEIPKPMPPLPVVYGVMGLPSGIKAIMSEKAGSPSTTIRPGESIGEFRVAALDSQNVTFDWNGKQTTRKIDDLIDRSNSQTSSGQQPAAVPGGPAAAPPPPQPANTHLTAADLGPDLTPTTKANRPGDNSPAGTVVEGYKKVCTPTPFGSMCQWAKQ